MPYHYIYRSVIHDRRAEADSEWNGITFRDRTIFCGFPYLLFTFLLPVGAVLMRDTMDAEVGYLASVDGLSVITARFHTIALVNGFILGVLPNVLSVIVFLAPPS